MGTMAKAVLIVNVGADPVTRATSDGTPVVNFRGAHSVTLPPKEEGGQNREITSWYSISAFGEGLAKVCGYLKKGSRVYIEGPMRVDAYGQRIDLAITAKQIVLLDRKPKEDGVQDNLAGSAEDFGGASNYDETDVEAVDELALASNS